MSNQKNTRRGSAARVAFFLVKAVVVSVSLAAITVFASPFAALAVVSVLLWAALFYMIRLFRREQMRAGRIHNDVRERYNSVIGVLCGALDLKDNIGSEHTSRVSQLASTVASELGLRHEEARLLQKAAFLADIGKAEIAENILNKPGELSDQEWTQMKRHPELGYEILSEFSHLRDAAEIVYSHHERFDGQGYPRGLKGDDIPIGARIHMVVDAYGAMTSDRPHRKKMSHDTAVKEILRNSLTQFDPEVVRAFVRCEERGLIMPDAPPDTSREEMEPMTMARALSAAS